MRRREFLWVVGGAAAAWPLAARAQQATLPVIGYLSGRTLNDSKPLVAAFRRGLQEAGFVDGQNVLIDYRWAGGQYAQLPTLASDLVSRRVALIAANGGSVVGLAAKSVTSTIPIVFTGGGDPVSSGLVASLSKPGGNITGVSVLSGALEAKRLEILGEVIPAVSTIVVLVNPTNPNAAPSIEDLNKAASTLARKILILNARTQDEIATAFATLANSRNSALLVFADPFFDTNRDRLVELSMRHAVPTIYAWREFPENGGLMSYGSDLASGYRQSGVYAGRILKGEKPADLAVQQSTRIELVINLKTAKTLGLTVPLSLLGRADEVIE